MLLIYNSKMQFCESMLTVVCGALWIYHREKKCLEATRSLPELRAH